MVFLRDMLFNLAHWFFCYKYWTISVQMESLIKSKLPSSAELTKFKIINIVFITLDTLLPFVYAYSYSVINFKYPNYVPDPVRPPKWLLIVYLASSYSKGILLFISAVFLADSMRRIRKTVKSLDQEQNLN